MKTSTTINLKRTISTTIGGLLLVGMTAAGIFFTGDLTPLQPRVEAQEEGQPESEAFSREKRVRCGNATLEGRYAVIGNGFAAPPPNPLLPFATISLMTLDGYGHLSNKVTRSNNGQISRSVDSGTYSVNADCTGTITVAVPNPPFQLTFDLVVSDLQGWHGKEFYFIATTPGGAITTTAKRIQ